VAASISQVRLRMLVLFLWLVVGLILLSNYTWSHHTGWSNVVQSGSKRSPISCAWFHPTPRPERCRPSSEGSQVVGDEGASAQRT